jgi:capsular exopolysaccharide synthesis family protein
VPGGIVPHPFMMVPGGRGLLPAVPPGQSSGPTGPALLKALGRRWLLALGLGVILAAGAGAAAWFLLAPKHMAFVQVKVAYTRPWYLFPFVDSPESKNEHDTYKRLQAAAMRSRFVFLNALKKDEVKRLSLVREQPDVIQWLENQLKVEVKEGTEIINLTMTGTKPDELFTLVNAVYQSYDELVVKKEEGERKDRVNRIQNALTEIQDRLHKNRKKLQDQTDENGGDPQALNVKQIILTTDLNDKKKRMGDVQGELLRARSNLATHQGNEKLLDSVTVSEITLNLAVDADEEVKDYRKRIKAAEQIIRSYEKYSPRADRLAHERRTRDDLKADFEKRQAKIKKALQEQHRLQARKDYETTLIQLRSAIPALAEAEKRLKEDVEELTKKISTLGTSSNLMDLLRDQIKLDEKQADEIAGRLHRFEMERGAGARVSQWDNGIQSQDPKRRIIGVILAPVFALGLAGLGVGWWEHRSRRIQGTEEVVHGVGLRVVGAVPALGGPGLRRLVAAEGPDDQEAHLLESIDAIRTTLLRDASALATRVIMVTSAVAGEGKTTLASNLATSLARAGRRTLLIDCDLRCPAAHQLFEQTLQPGLSEVLLGEIDLIDAIRPTTAMEGLWLIPAGEWDREVVQALAKRGVQEMFDRLKEEFDFIVVDSHPVLPATDSLVIGQHVDAVILSVLRDFSQVPRVHAAAQRLTNLGIRVAGAVVNGMSSDEVIEQGYPPVAGARA